MNVHVRYQGYSYDLTGDELDVGDLSSDTEVRTAVARYLDTPVAKLENFQLDRNAETQDITLRPGAIFGNII